MADYAGGSIIILVIINTQIDLKKIFVNDFMPVQSHHMQSVL